jgi:hypothetical protein
MRRSFASTLLLVSTATAVMAQGDRASRFMDNCRRNT